MWDQLILYGHWLRWWCNPVHSWSK